MLKINNIIYILQTELNFTVSRKINSYELLILDIEKFESELEKSYPWFSYYTFTRAIGDYNGSI
jgi:hypothetical protein